MKSEDPDDWYGAGEYLEKLQKHHPDFRSDEVAAFRKRIEDAQWIFNEGTVSVKY